MALPKKKDKPVLKDLHARAKQALAEARGFEDEKQKLKTAKTLTDARAAELDASYTAAFKVHEDLMVDVRRAQQMATSEDDLDAFDNDPVLVHPMDGDTGEDGDVETRTSRWHDEVDIDDRPLGRSRRGRPEDALYVKGGLADVRNARLLARVGQSAKPLTKEARAAFAKYIHMTREESLEPAEMRALDPYRDPDGGWALSHEVSREVIRQIREAVYIMQRARVISTTAASITFPVFKYRGTGQTARRAGDPYAIKDIRDILGRTTFTPNSFGEIVKVPEELFEDADYPIMEHLGQEMAEDGMEQKENFFLNGTGKNQPLGVLSSPIDDYPTAGAALAPDDIKGFPYKLKKSRRRNAAWMWNRTGLEVVSKMRDDSGAGVGTGNYLFREGLTEDDPDRLVGYPVMESEFFPDAFAAGAASGTAIALLGDWFNGYWIVMRSAIAIRRLDELYADEGMIGFRYRERYDGAPVRLDCFAVLEKA